MQQPPMQQGGGSGTSAIVDLLRVLYEPLEVFQRVAAKPRFLMPFIGLSLVAIVLAAVNLPFTKAVMQAQAAATPGAPDTSKFAVIGLLFVPVIIALILVLIGFVLWVLVSLVGGDAKFKTLLSVAAYTAVPSVVLLGIVGAIILQLQGPGNITSQQDLQPSVGLDLLAPSVKGFLGAVLKGVNPFAIWGLVLTAIGVSTTHRLSKGSGYVVATGTFVLGLLIAGMFGALFGGR